MCRHLSKRLGIRCVLELCQFWRNVADIALQGLFPLLDLLQEFADTLHALRFEELITISCGEIGGDFATFEHTDKTVIRRIELAGYLR